MIHRTSLIGYFMCGSFDLFSLARWQHWIYENNNIA